VKSDRATPIREVSIAICFDPGRPPAGGPNIAEALAKLHTLSARTCPNYGFFAPMI